MGVNARVAVASLVGRVTVIVGRVGWTVWVAVLVAVAGWGEGVESASSVPNAAAVWAAAVSTAFGSGPVAVGMAGEKLHEESRMATTRQATHTLRKEPNISTP
jgi:hypothetical protein